MTKILAGAPVDLDPRVAEIRVEIVDSVLRVLQRAARGIAWLQLDRDMSSLAFPESVCEKAEENQEIPIGKSVAEEEERPAHSSIYAVGGEIVIARNVDQKLEVIIVCYDR